MAEYNNTNDATAYNNDSTTSEKIITKTSESVSPGHPDKVADQISDAVLDFLNTLKPNAQSAVETACSANRLMIFGEVDAAVTTKYTRVELATKVSHIAHEKLLEIGYDRELYSPEIIVDLVTQSEQINSAVEKRATKTNTENADATIITENDDATKSTETVPYTPETGAGDQGITFGFATSETSSGHELHYLLAVEIQKALYHARISGAANWLLPDAKSQVTVSYKYNDDGIDTPISIDNILVSTSTAEPSDETNYEQMRSEINDLIVQVAKDTIETLRTTNLDDKFMLILSLRDTQIHINPAGLWTTPGPKYDSGLTGRKLVADNYGSAAPIGGGATSGKNLSKVDRSGAYVARHIALSVVKSDLADKCLVELGWEIGNPRPVSINVETFGTEKLELSEITNLINQNFNITVDNLIATYSAVPRFTQTSMFGNYTDENFPWEKPKSLV
jgi:S-adenosylmethionine synthetase